MGALAQVLRQMPKPTDPNLLVGTDNFDDAGVYRLDASTAIVLTLDFFPPLVDDPFTFGQIAAANALSDLYAMGARPITALNIVGFPDKDLPAEILAEILRGGAERVAAAGAVVAGGHSVRDSEIKYGLSVTGLIHPERILTNAGALPGDALLLTKPIGTAQLTTAAKQDKIPQDDLAEAIESMVELNRAASEAIIQLMDNGGGVHAVTDITGFGLIGHAFEMAQASDVTIEIDASRVPLMAKTLDLARAGVLTRAHKSNLEWVGDQLNTQEVDDTIVKVLADAQTSGGLLIAVAPDRADHLLDLLHERNTKTTAIIGSVSPPSKCRVRIHDPN
jgi:selenide, water dikinase